LTEEQRDIRTALLRLRERLGDDYRPLPSKDNRPQSCRGGGSHWSKIPDWFIHRHQASGERSSRVW
jgi:hypothetical protein